MRDENLFNEKRNILLAKSQEEGLVSISSLRELSKRFELSRDELNELYCYFESNNVLILLPVNHGLILYKRECRQKLGLNRNG